MKEIDAQIPQISRRTVLKGIGGLFVASAISGGFPIELLAAERIYSPGEVVRRGDRSVKRMFITIDDGGSLERVTHAASLAYDEGVKLTFFPTGLNVVKGKETWAQVLGKGHAVENHTWSHQNLRDLPREEVKRQLLMQEQIVSEAAELAGINNYRQIFLRPPYGAGKFDTEVISVCRELNKVIAMWSSDPQGWRNSVGENLIYQRYVRDFSNGLILLMHTNTKDMNVLPRVIREAKRQGYALDKTLRDGIKTTIYP